MLKNWRIAVVLMIVISGCAPSTYYPVSFVEYEYEPYNVKGTGSIEGILTLDGVKKIGNFIYLTPTTTLSKQVIDEELINGKTPEFPYDLRYRNYLIKSQTDSKGVFVFENLAEGSYYVFSYQGNLFINVDYLLRTSRSLKNSAVGFEQVQVIDGKQTKVILNLRSK